MRPINASNWTYPSRLIHHVFSEMEYQPQNAWPHSVQTEMKTILFIALAETNWEHNSQFSLQWTHVEDFQHILDIVFLPYEIIDIKNWILSFQFQRTSIWNAYLSLCAATATPQPYIKNVWARFILKWTLFHIFV